MSETAQLGLPLVEASQAQKHVTVNEAFSRIDALVQMSILSTTLTAPPASPADGDLFSVPVGGSGAWFGQDGSLALFQNGGWIFIAPVAGWGAWLSDIGVRAVFDGVDWAVGAGSMSANGAGFLHRSVEVDHALTAGAASTVAAAIPGNAIVYGISGRVLTAVGGPATFEIGVSGSTNRYGSGIGTGAGSWLRGITGTPLTYYADTDLVLTATGGSFDGTGTLRLAMHYAELTLPRA